MRTHLSRVVVLLLAVSLFSGCGRPAKRPASSLTDRDRAALASYEKIRAGLAADDLRAVKRGADELVKNVTPGSPSDQPSPFLEPAKTLAAAAAMDVSRDAFRKLSRPAIALAGDVEGFYVMTSVMTPNSDWLQTKPDVDNPYLGRAMHSIGELRK